MSAVVGLVGLLLGFVIGWLVRRDRVERATVGAVAADRDRAVASLTETSARLEAADRELVELRGRLTEVSEQLADRTAAVSRLQYDLAECRDELGIDQTQAVAPVSASADTVDRTQAVASAAADTVGLDADDAEVSEFAADVDTRGDLDLDVEPTAVGVDVDELSIDAVHTSEGQPDDEPEGPPGDDELVDVSDERADTSGVRIPADTAEASDTHATGDATLEAEVLETTRLRPVTAEERQVPGDTLFAPDDEELYDDDITEEVVIDRAEPEPVESDDAAAPEPVGPDDAAAPEPVGPDDAAAPEPVGPDDLQRITGVGPAMARMLEDEDITTFRRLAALTDAELDELQTRAPRLAGRIRRGEWRRQARDLHVEAYGREPS